MKPKLIVLAALVPLALLLCIRIAIAGSNPVPRIASIHKWTKVNPEPLKLPSPLNTLCAPVTAVQTSTDPHRNRFFTVYVNKQGRRAMLAARTPSFPAGSVIVKEKLADRGAKSAELLTAMVKHKRGYDPEGGDWEYQVLDGSGAKVIESGKLERCASCHAGQRKMDFVFRNYLPAKLTGRQARTARVESAYRP